MMGMIKKLTTTKAKDRIRLHLSESLLELMLCDDDEHNITYIYTPFV